MPWLLWLLLLDSVCCGAEVKVTQGRFTLVSEVLQTARCYRTNGTDHSRPFILKPIDLRRAYDNSSYLARHSPNTSRPNIRDLADRRRCVADAGVKGTQHFLEVTCLRSHLFDLTSEELLCEFGAELTQRPVITSTQVSLLDCRLQEGEEEHIPTDEQNAVPDSYNVVVTFLTPSGQRQVLQSEELTSAELVDCNATGGEGRVLCRKNTNCLVVIVNKEKISQSESPQCQLLRGKAAVWSGAVVKESECPAASSESQLAWALFGVVAFLVVVIIVCVVVRWVRVRKRAEGQPNTSTTVQTLLQPLEETGAPPDGKLEEGTD